MRIAVTTRTLARVGGVEAYVERSAQGLVAAGHDVCVFPEDGARSAGGLDVPAWTPRSRGSESLADAVRDYAPDVLVTHGLDDPGLEAVLAAIRPSVFFAHAYHGTCISGSKAHSFPAVRPCTHGLWVTPLSLEFETLSPPNSDAVVCPTGFAPPRPKRRWSIVPV